MNGLTTFEKSFVRICVLYCILILRWNIIVTYLGKFFARWDEIRKKFLRYILYLFKIIISEVPICPVKRTFVAKLIINRSSVGYFSAMYKNTWCYEDHIVDNNLENLNIVLMGTILNFNQSYSNVFVKNLTKEVTPASNCN